MKNADQIPENTLTTKKLSELTHLTERRLYGLARDGKIPRSSAGLWKGDETISALFTYFQRESKNLSRERLLKTAAERELKQIEVAKASGRFQSVDVFNKDLVAIGKTLNGAIIANERVLEKSIASEIVTSMPALDDGQKVAVAMITGNAVIKALDALRAALAKALEESIPPETKEAP